MKPIYKIWWALTALELAVLPIMLFAQPTNAPGPEPAKEVIPYLNKVLQWNESLLGLPALPLVVLGCIAVGYLIKSLPTVANNKIPSRVMFTGVVLYVGITASALPQFVEWRQVIAWAVRTVILGLIAGVIAWVMHRTMLRKLEEKWGWFKDDTAFLKNPNPPMPASVVTTVTETKVTPAVPTETTKPKE